MPGYQPDGIGELHDTMKGTSVLLVFLVLISGLSFVVPFKVNAAQVLPCGYYVTVAPGPDYLEYRCSDGVQTHSQTGGNACTLINTALTDAGNSGNGTVLFSSGIFFCTTPLTLPTGVALHGASGYGDGAHHIAQTILDFRPASTITAALHLSNGQNEVRDLWVNTSAKVDVALLDSESGGSLDSLKVFNFNNTGVGLELTSAGNFVSDVEVSSNTVSGMSLYLNGDSVNSFSNLVADTGGVYINGTTDTFTNLQTSGSSPVEFGKGAAGNSMSPIVASLITFDLGAKRNMIGEANSFGGFPTVIDNSDQTNYACPPIGTLLCGAPAADPDPATTVNNYPISQGKGIEGTWNSWVLFDKVAIVPPICGSTCINAGDIGTSALDVSAINNESLKVFASPASTGGTNVGCYIDYDIIYKIVRDVQCLVPVFDRTGLKPYGTSALGEYIVYPLVCNACGFNIVADYNGTTPEVWHFLYSYIYNFGTAGAGEPTPGQIGIDPTGQWVVILSPDTSNSDATTLWIFKGIGTPASPIADPDPTVGPVGGGPTSCTSALGYVCLTTTSTNTTSTTQTSSTGTCAANQCLPPDVTILGIPVLDLVLGIAIVLLVLVAAYLLGRTKKGRGSSLSSAESASRIL